MKKAMLLSAGLGTRLKPFTLHHPKALAQVNNKTLLQRNIEYLKSFGIEEIVINVHHFADQIISFLKEHDFGVTTYISDESNEVLETGGGVLKARPLLEDADHVFVMNVDILTNVDLQDMMDKHIASKALVTLGVSTRESSRGLLFDADMQLCGWHNKQTGEEKMVAIEQAHTEGAPHLIEPYFSNAHDLIDFAFSGIQLISTKLFPLIKQKGKFSIIDVYLDVARTEKILGYDHSGRLLMDVGKPESILKAEKMFE